MKVALITGITGQDGSYLAELLLEKGYVVWGIIRKCSSINTKRIDHIFDKLIIRYGDLLDTNIFINILLSIKNSYDFDTLEIYNLAAMSHVKVSFEMPEYTGNVDALGTVRLLEAIRSCELIDKVRFYQASTSELYGNTDESPQNENTPFKPCSPYSCAKLYSYWIVNTYRQAYNLFAVNGILFNHESPRRGETFVSRKITIALNNLITGKQDKLTLGNLDSVRDWGHAKDYVYGMWLMMQQKKADNYVLATGTSHTVREFVEKSFQLKGIHIQWKGKGVNEIGYDSTTGREYINISDKYFRPNEVNLLLGDYTKAKQLLDWKPKISFDQLIKDMVDNDCMN